MIFDELLHHPFCRKLVVYGTVLDGTVASVFLKRVNVTAGSL